MADAGAYSNQEDARVRALSVEHLRLQKTPGVWEDVSTSLKQIDLVSTNQDPFALHKVLAECVVAEFDRALWTFQPVIRDIEKTRMKHTEREESNQEDAEKRHKELGTLIGRYTAMHELSRHVIHISETLAVASRTMKSIAEEHTEFCQQQDLAAEITERSKRITKSLHLSAQLLNNFQNRAQAFVARLHNEIQLV
ncbi:MAG: hypothetical protein Q9178_004706 [Gyalolechia marmorata]